MLKSTTDDVCLGQAIEDRMGDLANSYLRIRGVDLRVPEILRNDFVRYTAYRERHKKGDHRHTESELKSVREIAQWTVQVNCALRNQPPKHVDWGN